MQKNSLSYCGDVVMRHDPDRFLLSMFAPQTIREDLWALFAFNHEIAKTRSVVSESTLGLIRLQWWRDEITRIYDGGIPPAHEILKPLALAIGKHSLPRGHFETLIYAREFDLEDVLPGNLEGLINYADFTTAPLLKLAVKIMGDDPEMELVHPIAINYALAGILRAAPFHAREARCFFPEDLMKKQGVTRENFFNFEKTEDFERIAQSIAGAQTKGIRPENKLLKASDILADIYFSHIKSLKYNVFSPKAILPPPFKALRLYLRTKF